MSSLASHFLVVFGARVLTPTKTVFNVGGIHINMNIILVTCEANIAPTGYVHIRVHCLTSRDSGEINTDVYPYKRAIVRTKYRVHLGPPFFERPKREKQTPDFCLVTAERSCGLGGSVS